jgi:AraC family transcriptional regulator of adaptative response/methylated-DNA-[protein]-cysteine methyltransferase
MTKDDQSYHYNVMRRALDLLDGTDGALSLSELSVRMDMSPAHFQRLFSSWVGVSPKKYQQYLTLGYAKTLLRDRCTTLQTSNMVGLSGGGRLHDLFLKWEAMSPGEFAQKGAGLTIFWGWFDTPFGPALVMGTKRGICGIGFGAETDKDHAMKDLIARWPRADFVEDPTPLNPWVKTAFSTDDDRRSTPLHVIGAPFQIKVWEALMAIPSGHVVTYSQIADHIGHPKAVRAVGTAVGRNPISFLIPCHRALRKSGGLGGYHWGMPVKRVLLAWEAARSET